MAVKQIERGLWLVDVSDAFDPLTGKQRRHRERVKGTKKDAEARERDIIRQNELGLRADADKVTFGEFSKQWLERRKASGEWATKTMKHNEMIVKGLNDYLAAIRLKDIDAQTMEAVLAKLKAGEKSETHREISGTTLLQYYRKAKEIFQKAVDYEILLRNPMDKVKAPKKNTVDRKSLTEDEFARLARVLDVTLSDAYRANNEKETRQAEWGNLFGRSYLKSIAGISCIIGAHLGLATGARREEVLGFTWGDVDFATKTLKVRRAVVSTSEGKEVKGTKTDGSVRTITVHGDIMGMLAKWRSYQAAQLLKLGVHTNQSTPVVCDGTGDFMDPAHFSRWWRSWTTENGFEGLKFHELRHTQATQLIGHGADIKTVQSRLGHKSAEMTLQVYAHAMPANDEKAALVVEQLFAKGTSTGAVLEPDFVTARHKLGAKGDSAAEKQKGQAVKTTA